MIPNKIKAVLLLGALSGLLLAMGSIIGGVKGLQVAFIMALVMNFVSYFFSESIVLKMYNAQPLDKDKYSWIYETVQELCQTIKIPMPRLWIVSMPIANAFATGRNPQHASVVVTSGILELLDKDELRGVLAHELSHVKNRDILVTTMAATLATAIGYVANILQYSAMFGSMGSDDNRRRPNPLIALIIAMIMPFAASLLQLALSRSREYLADESGANYCHEPLALASALAKISNNKQYTPANSAVEATTSPLFIINPLTSSAAWASLFSTHPPVEKRIEKLQAMAQKMH